MERDTADTASSSNTSTANRHAKNYLLTQRYARRMMADMPQPELISTAEAQQILGYANPSSVARLVYEGKLPYVRQMGGGKHGAYIFDRNVVEALAAERATEAAL